MNIKQQKLIKTFLIEEFGVDNGKELLRYNYKKMPLAHCLRRK